MNQDNNGMQNYNNETNINNNQPINVVEQPKKGNTLLIIFMVISIALAGFLVYDKLLKEKDTNWCQEQGNENNNTNENNSENKNTNENNSENKNTDENNSENKNTNENNSNQTGKIQVVDAYVKVAGYSVYAGKEIKIPKLTGNSNAVISFNDKILKDSLDSIIGYKDRMMNNLADVENNKIFVVTESYVISNYYDCYNSFNFSYSHFTKNDIITIKVDYDLDNSTLDEGMCHNATGDDFDADEYYFYDIKNDKELSLKEAAEKFNTTFEEGSQCNSFSDLNDAEYKWGSLGIDLDEEQNMKISCSENL